MGHWLRGTTRQNLESANLEDATAIRARILSAFERPKWAIDDSERAKLLTFVVVGAGPTGVELAGTIAELARETLRRDFRNFDTRDARVVLIEAGHAILRGYDSGLSPTSATG